jgi:hypothetical protein
MIAESDAASIFRGTRGSRSIEISAPGAFTAVGFSGQQKNPRASAAERGRPSLFKTIDEDRRQRHDHINRSGRSTYPERISVLISGATPLLLENGADLRATAPQAPAPLNLSLVALAQEEHERQKAVNPIGHLYVLDILAAHGLHSDPATTVKYAMEEAYLKCCYVPLSH